MLDFMIYSPTRILFGKSAIARLPEMLKLYKATNILVLYDEDALEKCGAREQLFRYLDETGVPYTYATGIKPNPRVSLVYKYIDFCRENNVDFILAIGGGSTIDSAKAIAAGVLHDGDLWDCFAEGKPWGGALPVGVILTLPASGSETSGGSVVLKEETREKRYISGEDLRPKFAILNPEFTYSLPAYQTACGIADIISHLMERYFTVANDTDINDRLVEGAIRTMLEIGPALLANPNDYNLRAQMMWTGTLAEHGILNAGIFCDWPAHDIAHELGGFYDIAHGATLSIILPAWMRCIWQVCPEKFRQFAVLIMGLDETGKSIEDIIESGICELEVFFKKIGMPIRLSEVNVKKDQLIAMARSTMRGRPYLGCFARLTEEDVLRIYRMAL